MHSIEYPFATQSKTITTQQDRGKIVSHLQRNSISWQYPITNATQINIIATQEYHGDKVILLATVF